MSLDIYLNKITLFDVNNPLPLPDDSIDCVVTSPPYWGLRDYGTGRWEGGAEDCDHSPGNISRVEKTTLQGGKNTAGNQKEGYSNICAKCGAQRIDKQIGLEGTPEKYVSKMVEIFRDIRRVLKPNGTCWLNLGDSYYNGNKGGIWDERRVKYSPLQQNNSGSLRINQPNRNFIQGFKPKDLIGIPWRVAFALQADGWWLRQDIIWRKPNPMPESVKDRCTKAHEYIFLLTKSAKYFYDADAIKESWKDNKYDIERAIKGVKYNGKYKDGYISCDDHLYHTATGGPIGKPQNGRNKRSVWEISNQPFPEAHFATFPEELPKLCILAGCPVNGIVLDPFAGSGTVGKVATELGRNFILFELNSEYIKIAKKRINTSMNLFQHFNRENP